MTITEENIIKKIITEVIDKPAQKEAFTIMTNAFDEDKKEFIRHYKEKQYHAVCIRIDYSKWNLVKANKLKHNAKDYFGSPFL